MDACKDCGEERVGMCLNCSHEFQEESSVGVLLQEIILRREISKIKTKMENAALTDEKFNELYDIYLNKNLELVQVSKKVDDLFPKATNIKI